MAFVLLPAASLNQALAPGYLLGLSSANVVVDFADRAQLNASYNKLAERVSGLVLDPTQDNAPDKLARMVFLR